VILLEMRMKHVRHFAYLLSLLRLMYSMVEVETPNRSASAGLDTFRHADFNVSCSINNLQIS